MVEFALILPVLLLILLMAVDAGRLFFGWVNLQNTARIAANYAANYANAPNPTWGPGSVYDGQIRADATTINCDLPASLPAPTFPDGTSLGLNSQGTPNSAHVSLTCGFHLFTPFLGNMLGNPVELGASAVFPIKVGIIGGGQVSGTFPTPTPTSTATPSPTASPKWCTVPAFLGMSLDSAPQAWSDAGFVPSNLTVSFYTSGQVVGHEAPPNQDGTQAKCSNFKLTVGP